MSTPTVTTRTLDMCDPDEAHNAEVKALDAVSKELAERVEQALDAEEAAAAADEAELDAEEERVAKMLAADEDDDDKDDDEGDKGKGKVEDKEDDDAVKVFLCLRPRQDDPRRDPNALNAVHDMHNVRIMGRNQRRVLELVREAADPHWYLSTPAKVVSAQRPLNYALDIPWREIKPYAKKVEHKNTGKITYEIKLPKSKQARLVAQYCVNPTHEQIEARALYTVLLHGRGYATTTDIISDYEDVCRSMLSAYDLISQERSLPPRGPRPQSLVTPFIVSMVCLYTVPIARLDLTATGRAAEGGSLGVWRRSTGLWCCESDTQPDAATTVVEDLLLLTSPTMRNKHRRAEAVTWLKSSEATLLLQPVPDPRYIPCKNGIVDISHPDPATGACPVLAYTPDWTFTHSSAYPYDPAAPCPAYTYNGNKVFRPDTWLDSISVDPTIDPAYDLSLPVRQLTIRQVLAKAINPAIPTRQAFCMFDTRGRTNKGTFCRAIASLVGPSAVFETSLQSLGRAANAFPLDGLGTKSVVLLEENDTSATVDSATLLKNLITEETLVINRKYRQQEQQRFRGLVVLALNEMPKIKDKSDSLKRRLFIRQFKKRISLNEECTEIKDVWLSKDAPTLTYLTKIAVDAARDWYHSGMLGKFAATEEDNSMLARFELRNDDVSAFVFDTLRDGVDGVPLYVEGDGKTMSATRDDDMPYRDDMTPSDATGGSRLCALTFNFLWANFQAWSKDNGGASGISIKKSNFKERLHECLPESWIPRLTPDDNGGKEPKVRIHKGTVALDVTKDGKARQVYAGGSIRSCILDRAEYGKAGE